MYVASVPYGLASEASVAIAANALRIGLNRDHVAYSAAPLFVFDYNTHSGFM